MKTLLLNLPNSHAIMRRYMCSYNSPDFLFPPMELMSLGAIVKNWKRGDVLLVDAIAEKLSLKATLDMIKSFSPNIIVTLLAFESFTEDMEVIHHLKASFPGIKLVCFGYYPTIFPEEILQRTKIDYILREEPEIPFSDLYDALERGEKYPDAHGIAYLKEEKPVVNSAKRNFDLNNLPFPDRSLVRTDFYSSKLMKKPFTAIQTSRGCPFSCNYCVRTYGKVLVERSPENILQELEEIVNKYKITNIRFLDDTLNIKKERVKIICQEIIKRGLKFNWSCLTRIDTTNKENLQLMHKAGCQQIYVGIESGSQEVLDYYQKGYPVKNVIENIRLIREAKIECIGWFIVGGPGENEETFNHSIQLACTADLDYVIVSKIIPYPGTRLFERLKNKIDFSLFPYLNRFSETESDEKYLQRERKFYRKFYFRPRFILKSIFNFIRSPYRMLKDFKQIFLFVFNFKFNKIREDLY